MSDKKKAVKEPEIDLKQANKDAQTLAEANLISSDPNRLTRAKEAASAIINEQKNKLNPMKKVAGRSRVTKPNDSKPKKKKSKFNVFEKV